MKNLFATTVLLFCFVGQAFAGYGFDGHNQSTTLTNNSNKKMLQNAASGVASNTITGGSNAEVYINFQYDTTGKSVFIVYTTNGSNPSKTNGTSASCSFHNYTDPDRTWVCSIPSGANTQGTTVKYVLYISDSTLGAAWGRGATNSTIATSWAEGDAAFSYTVQAALATAAVTSLNAQVTENGAQLTWHGMGSADTFVLEHSLNQQTWSEIGTLSTETSSFTVAGLAIGTHYFRIKASSNGATSYSPVAVATIEVPNQYVMYPAYPNPFNPSTNIRFAVAQKQTVHVTMYNVLGQTVKTLFTGSVEANALQTLQINASELQSGTYIVRVAGQTFAATQKITLAK